jgi:hypothetical protein
VTNLHNVARHDYIAATHAQAPGRSTGVVNHAKARNRTESGENCPEKRRAPPPNDNAYAIGDSAEFARNVMRVGVRLQRLLTEFAKRQPEKGSTPLDPNVVGYCIGGTFWAAAN